MGYRRCIHSSRTCLLSAVSILADFISFLVDASFFFYCRLGGSLFVVRPGQHGHIRKLDIGSDGLSGLFAAVRLQCDVYNIFEDSRKSNFVHIQVHRQFR